jgi:hypothetical protein
VWAAWFVCFDREAYVIYCFLSLVLMYCGGDAAAVQKIAPLGFIRHPWPMCWLPPLKTDGTLLRLCKKGAIQFVVIKPLMAVISCVMMSMDLFWDPSYQMFLNVVYNLAYTVALYALVLFYTATKTMLAEYHPVNKFLAVKGLVFLTFWQMLFIDMLPGLSRNDKESLNDLILCVEMVGFASYHYCAFTYKVYVVAIPTTTSTLSNLVDVMSVKDVVEVCARGRLCVCVCVCVLVHVRACMRVCAHACVFAWDVRTHVCVYVLSVGVVGWGACMLARAVYVCACVCG